MRQIRILSALILATCALGALAGSAGAAANPVLGAKAFAAPYGARLAHRWPKRRLEVCFGLFLLAVSLRLAFTLG